MIWQIHATEGKIRAMAAHNVLVHAAVAAYDHGSFESWEGMLAALVEGLAITNRQLEEAVQNLLAAQRNPIVMSADYDPPSAMPPG